MARSKKKPVETIEEGNAEEVRNHEQEEVEENG